jgi:hypothetical protein
VNVTCFDQRIGNGRTSPTVGPQPVQAAVEVVRAVSRALEDFAMVARRGNDTARSETIDFRHWRAVRRGWSDRSVDDADAVGTV